MPPAAPPSDASLRAAIDVLAFHVAKNGATYERFMRDQQARDGGAGGSFLLGGPGAAYYAFKVLRWGPRHARHEAVH